MTAATRRPKAFLRAKFAAAGLSDRVDVAPAFGSTAVPDPYHGGAAGFETVLDDIGAACDGLVEHLSKTIKP